MSVEIVVQETKLELVNDGDTLVLESTPTVVELVIGGAPTYTATDDNAIHDNVASEISAIIEKASPVSADLILIEDSEASNAKKKIQISNLPSGVSDVSDLTTDTGNATEMVRVDGAGTGLEYRTQAQVLSDIGALSSADIDTLAELNAILTDAALIDTADSRLSDSRTPTAHAASHGDGGSDEITITESQISDLQTYLKSADIDTLAELNAIITDATLDDSGDARTPTAHNHAASDVNSGTFDDARIAQSSVTQHQTALSITESQISDLAHTTSASDLTSGTLADARVAQSNVTQHQTALSITESQISDLSHFGGALNDLSDVANSTPANRHVIAYDGVTDNQYENRPLVEADISDLGSYLTAETNDLTVAVTWANVPDGNITESSVTQHEGAIDHDALANFVANEHLDWTQSGAGTIHANNYVDNDTTDHTALSNIGTNTHGQIDSHITGTGTAVHGLGAVSLTNLATNSGLSISGADIALGTPLTLTISTTNVVTTSAHSHAITTTSNATSTPSTILAADSSGYLRLTTLGVGVPSSQGTDKLAVYAEGLTYSSIRGFTDTSFHRHNLNISRARGTIASVSTVNNGDWLGALNFQGYGSTLYADAAQINCKVDGTFTGNDVPGKIEFRTKPSSGGGTLARLIITSNGRVGVGDNVASLTPAAQLHVDQSSTTSAIPTLYLDQADISEEMIQFETTIGTGNAIEAIGAKTLTTTHFIKVTIPGGLTRYIPCGTIA